MTDATEERSRMDGDDDGLVKRRGIYSAIKLFISAGGKFMLTRQTEERTGAVKFPCNERCIASFTCLTPSRVEYFIESSILGSYPAISITGRTLDTPAHITRVSKDPHADKP